MVGERLYPGQLFLIGDGYLRTWKEGLGTGWEWPKVNPSLSRSAEALEWLTEEMERVYGLKVRLSDDGAPKPLDEPSRTTLFRAVRELLINVAKHAGTGMAEVTSLRSDSRLTIAVNDDGGGFDYQKALQAAPGEGGLGLVSLRERIEFIGGEMHVDSSPNERPRLEGSMAAATWPGMRSMRQMFFSRKVPCTLSRRWLV